MTEEIAIPLIVFTATTIMVIGFPIARAIARRMDRQSVQPATPPELLGRLERMEQAIDSIAVEVERISEGQRFTTRLLSGKSPGGEAGADTAAGTAR